MTTVQECVTHKKKKTHFVKIHVPWRTLSVYAEYLLLRAPLKVCLTLCLSVFLCVGTFHLANNIIYIRQRKK